MLRRLMLFFLMGVIFFSCLTHGALAAVEWSRQQSLKIDGTPVDIAVSANGKFTFVLLASGEVTIYNAQGKVEGTIVAGKNFNGIESSPVGDKIFLMDSLSNDVQIFTVEYVKEINITGSPYKGPADAPVVIAIFSDFQ